MTLSRPFQVGRIYRDDDATILADGKRLRVPTMMRDGETNSVCDDRGNRTLSGERSLSLMRRHWRQRQRNPQ
jgi:hypothetical protein